MENSILISTYFRSHFPIDWTRGNMYFVDDLYYKIPALPFRFDKTVSDEIYNDLKKRVESFEGKLQWTVFQSFDSKKIRNHILCPMQLYNMYKHNNDIEAFVSEKDYFSEKEYRNICEQAVEDIPNLYQCIKTDSNLEKYKKMMS